MFDLSIPKLLVLAVIALVVFGPNELPKLAAQAGRALRDLRQIAEGAMNDLRDGLGPELADFEIEDLNPKRLAHEHLVDDLNADQAAQQQPAANGTALTPGEYPPSGPNATGPHGAEQARQGDRSHGPGRGDRNDGTSPATGGPVIINIRAALIRGGALVTAQIGRCTGTISPATAAALVLAVLLSVVLLPGTALTVLAGPRREVPR